MTFDILNYLGKKDEFVYVSLLLNYEDEFYESIFFYSKEAVGISVKSDLEEKLNCPIEEWYGYDELMLNIIDKVYKYDEIINELENLQL